jgi:nitrate reductase NapAB chaperone NapD
VTDRFSGFVVTLEETLREDHAQETINAIMQIKGVVAVKPIVQNIDIQLAEEHAKHELRQKLWDVLH